MSIKPVRLRSKACHVCLRTDLLTEIRITLSGEKKQFELQNHPKESAYGGISARTAERTLWPHPVFGILSVDVKRCGLKSLKAQRGGARHGASPG